MVKMLEIMPLLLRLLPMIVSLGSNPDIQALLQQLAKSGQAAFPDVKDPTMAATAASSLFDQNAILWVQAALNMQGQGIAIDGVYGDGTKKAVAAFQEAKGLDVDGWAGAKTQEALRAALVPSKGIK